MLSTVVVDVVTTWNSTDYLSPQPTLETLTKFSAEETSVRTPVPFEIGYLDDPEAEDIGGGIKGQMIDLGFDDVSKGWWHAQWTDIYLLQ